MVDAIARAQTPDRVRHVPVPPDARALSTLARIDYENALLVDIGPAQDRTAEQWARAVLEDAPADTRRALTSGWSALGLQLSSTQPDRHVLGWPVRRSTPDLTLLGTSSHLGLEGELLFQRQQHTLLLASFIHLDNDDTRAVWAGVEDRHPQVMHQLLEQALSRTTRA